MREFKIIYIEDDKINKTKIIEAKNIIDALTVFIMNYKHTDITSVVEVKEGDA